MTSPQTLNRKIQDLAHEVGFDEVGFTPLESLKEAEAAIREWTQKGYHGGMQYLEDYGKRREEFLKDFPRGRGVIVLGVNYYTSHSSSKKKNSLTSLKGQVARYAWGQDYHHVLAEKHARLIEEMKKHLGQSLQAVSCVDTRPIPERFAAQKAGLGFLGKNTMLLSQKFGPWLFLSEIITDLELAESLPSEGDCGTCVKCQRLCPTGALDEDYTMDASKCIAYLTIEHKGEIPRALRPKMKDWIFGCDECLSVCPFTSKQKESKWTSLLPASGQGPLLDLQRLFDLTSNRLYAKEFSGTALLRASRKQMLRNACIVLGNSGRPEALPLLEKAIQDAAPLVRSHAAWALGQFPEVESRRILERHAASEKDPGVREEITLALKA